MQWHQLDYMQTMCTSLQTDNHTNTSSLNFYRPDALPDILRTVSKHWRAQCSPHSSLNRCPQSPEWVGIDRHDKYVSKRPCGSCWLSASERPCLRGSFVMLPGSQFSVTPHTHTVSIHQSPTAHHWNVLQEIFIWRFFLHKFFVIIIIVVVTILV